MVSAAASPCPTADIDPGPLWFCCPRPDVKRHRNVMFILSSSVPWHLFSSGYPRLFYLSPHSIFTMLINAIVCMEKSPGGWRICSGFSGLLATSGRGPAGRWTSVTEVGSGPWSVWHVVGTADGGEEEGQRYLPGFPSRPPSHLSRTDRLWAE